MTRQNTSSSHPNHSSSIHPVVAVGASMGGLEAFRDLLSHLPSNTGMIYIFVMHLDPGYESKLSEILSHSTRMEVVKIKNEMRVKPDTVYVIPPDHFIIFDGQSLLLEKRHARAEPFFPVDRLFESVAQQMGKKSIGVLLSGTGSDGTRGIKAIRQAGGLTLAQNKATAEQTGMPDSAISEGAVDFILDPSQIALQLEKLALYIEPENQVDFDQKDLHEELNRIFHIIKERTDHNIWNYKSTTLRRRIQRRMILRQTETMHDYVNLLEEDPAEADKLFQDILINVSGFFRDTEDLEKLKSTVFAQLLSQQQTEQIDLRIWIPGVSTGEEAYSIAILLLEYIEENNFEPGRIQIFATDIDEKAIEVGRRGLYSDRIEKEVSEERLDRFFTRVSGGYQVNQSIREICVFAIQDVTTDPPFSRMDLVSCRNLLIYLIQDVQKKVFNIFHYALKKNGYLLLGSSESIGANTGLFEKIDQDHKIYRKRKADSHHNVMDQNSEPYIWPHAGETPGESAKENQNTIYDLADRAAGLYYVPPGVLINEQMDILQFRGATGPFLDPAPGDASLNLLKMLHSDLIFFVSNLAGQVRATEQPARKENIQLIKGEQKLNLDLQVLPVGNYDQGNSYMLVLFESRPAYDDSSSQEAEHLSEAENKRIYQLEEELESSRSYLNSLIEEKNRSNEELKAANEEIKASNEELQSTNQELETTKDELRAINEQLASVNEEKETRIGQLNEKVEELTGMIRSLNIPVLVLDEKLQVTMFTPSAEKLLNLIESDRGRPIKQIRTNIEIPELENHARQVIDDLVTKNFTGKDNTGKSYNVRILPYRINQNRLGGAIVTFIDLDHTEKAHSV